MKYMNGLSTGAKEKEYVNNVVTLLVLFVQNVGIIQREVGKMGMAIDKAIIHGQEQLEIFGGEHKEFIETAIDTMRKYQQTEQILDDCDLEAWEVLEKVKEVVEDGKID